MASDAPRGYRQPALVVALFVASGAAALIYEIAWFQLLQLVVGSTAVSLAVLLATFMGGMCIGSVLLPRVLPASRHPLAVYAALEAATAAAALLVLVLLPFVREVYFTAVGYGVPGLLLRGSVAALCLLPPTILMGATLPAIARWVEATRAGVSWMGFFYAGNIAGAVIGCLAAGFYLLPRLDMTTTTLVGVGLNVAAAAGAWVLAASLPARLASPPEPGALDRHGRTAPRVSGEEAPAPARAGVVWRIHVAIALSGVAALGAEVIWTRVLSLLLGATVYVFSIILAIFLLGLGIGSTAGAALARVVRNPRLAFGITQLLAALALFWAAWLLGRWLPYWPLNPSQAISASLLFQLDLLRCALTVLPGALLWGASFPLALAAIAQPGQDPGRMVGGLYAANTLGAIVGAIGASLLAVQSIGTQGAQQALILVSAVAAGVALIPVSPRRPLPVWLAYAAAAIVLLITAVPPLPALLLAYGRYVGVVITGDFDVLYAAEGLNASIAVTETADGVRNFHVSGKIEASNHPQDMPLQRMLGHIPALIHPDPASVLVVGFGAGVTAGSFVPYPEVRRIVVAEIEPLIPQVVSTHFSRENHDVVRDPRVQIVYDDARHFVQTTDETFDIITSDPIHPWVKGSATLFTREYFEALRRRLNPGGLISQWIPLYESNADVVRSELATFFEVFPSATIWANRQRGGGYDVVLLGQRDAAPIDMTAARQRLQDPLHARAADALRAVGFSSATALFATYTGRASDLGPWLEGAAINRDRNLRLQYMAGFQANVYQSDAIYAAMRRYRRFPSPALTGEPTDMKNLATLVESQQ